jgi:predicted DNA-binding transcriptional regulator YafY
MPTEMNTTIPEVEELKRLRSQMEDTERQIVAKIQQEMKGLPAKFGYENMGAFIHALRALDEEGEAVTSQTKSSSRKKSVRLSVQQTNEVVALLNATPSVTAAEIAAKFGVSQSKINGIKKQAGLVTARGPRKAK